MESSTKFIALCSHGRLLKSLVVVVCLHFTPFVHGFISRIASDRGIVSFHRNELFVSHNQNVDFNISSESQLLSEPSLIQHPALRNIYAKMMEYKAEYGHPNIPLPEGKGLDTVRRLHIQNKLLESEVKLLDSIGFRFHSLEDVYDYANFDEMFHKLLLYRDEFGDVSPKKKHKQDPELGAWVTGIRRRGQDSILKEHTDRLNSIGFEWNSPRQCGSTFMQQYRSILERKQIDDEVKVLEDETIRKWVVAMQKATLSETRQHYMETLFGEEWKQITV